ncbi:MAG: M42 family peptidase, partial [Firmicutes bacterium]|nr:M42 family peptidase [Bacillota bacterium]
RCGIPVAVISVPCRYIHSPVGVLNLNDLALTVKLIDAFLRDIEQRGLPI